MSGDKNKKYGELEKIGNNIKMLRKKRWSSYLSDSIKYKKYACCKTQETFAEGLDVERRAVSSWENGKTEPTLENLIKICNLLDCNIDYLLGAEKMPNFALIAKASNVTGIDAEILEAAEENSDYREYINFFMNPQRSAKLVSKATLAAWKQYRVSEYLSEIKEPLLEIVKCSFDKFFSCTPFDEIAVCKYKEFLKEALPKDKLNFCPKKTLIKIQNGAVNIINVKDSLGWLKWREFQEKKSSGDEYESFIDFLAQLTYEPLLNNEYLKVQKHNITDEFMKILSDYLLDV